MGYHLHLPLLKIQTSALFLKAKHALALHRKTGSASPTSTCTTPVSGGYDNAVTSTLEPLSPSDGLLPPLALDPTTTAMSTASSPPLAAPSAATLVSRPSSFSIRSTAVPAAAAVGSAAALSKKSKSTSKLRMGRSFRLRSSSSGNLPTNPYSDMWYPNSMASLRSPIDAFAPSTQHANGTRRISRPGVMSFPANSMSRDNIHSSSHYSQSGLSVSSTAIAQRAPHIGSKDFLSQLPYEIATYILQFLDMQHIVKVARISRTWHLLANDNEVWKCVFLIHRGWKIHLPNPSRQAPSGPFASMTLPKESKAYSALYSTSSSNLKNPFLVSSPTRLTSHASLTPPSPPPRVYWKKLCHDRLMIQQRWNKVPHKSRLVGHDDSVYCIQFDHEKIVTGSRDRTIKFWDIHTYQNTHTLKGHTQSVLCLQFNEHMMVSGSSDTTIIVWDMATRTKTHQLCGHTAGVLDVCFDDEYIVSCSKDATIKVWDVKTKKLLRTMVGHRGPVNAVQLHRGKVVSASGDGLVKLWNIETGVCERDFVGHERGLACVQFDGRTIVSGSNDRTIRIWNAATGECTKILRGHTNLVRTLHFSGTRIVSGSYDNSVKVWDMETGLCTLSLDKGGHESWVFDVQFSDTKIISTSQDKNILVWNFAHGYDTRYFV